MNLRVVLAAAAMAIAGCAAAPVNEVHAAPETHATPRARSHALPATGLEFAVEPAAAEIFIDGQPRGTVGELAATGGILSLPPGIYQVSLKAEGRATWRAEVAVRSARERIAVKLVPKS